MTLKKLPKVELHRHLEGAIRLETIKELADTLGIEMPDDRAELREKVLVTRPMENLAVVLGKFWLTQSVLASEEILERIAFEACEDAHLEGIRILELRYAPSFIQINHPGLNYDSIHSAIVKGIRRAEKTYPIAVGLIGIVVRVDPMDVATRVTDFIIDHKDTFVAIDLAGDEVGYECVKFSHLFLKAKKAGLHVTVHAGEADVAGSAGFVKDAIECLGAERIGHGVQIYQDPVMIEFVKKAGVTLELCPTSNWLTSAVKSLKLHPFRQLMSAGVKVTLNSDDPGLFGIDLTNEYQVLSHELGFTEAEFVVLNRTAAASSFISAAEKARVWKS
jgi:adenosine deaminase